MDFIFINSLAVLMIGGGSYFANILYKHEKVNKYDSGEEG
jgi:hypothetical protein